jgi:hypothetical protein
VINPIGATSHLENKKDKHKIQKCEGKGIHMDFVLPVKTQ